MPTPVLVVDDAIAHAEPALGSIATLHRVRAAEIPSTVATLQPDGLIVRSVTRVDAGLLDRAPSLRFVATATAGTDHLDLPTLRERGIHVASAAGCNALAVAQWVVAALVRVWPTLPEAITAGPIGVVGFGNVGSRLVPLLRRLGHEVLACDPPLARAWARAGSSSEPLLEFDALWQRCSIVSFHVPLIPDGPDRTLAYLDAQLPAAAGPKLIVNSSRGEVVCDRALDRPDIVAAILDVWDGEPELRWDRLRDPKLRLGSPHVAGYSLEAKLAATRLMHEAVCAWLGRPPSWTGAELLPACALAHGPSAPADLLAQVVDLDGDDRRIRALASLPEPERAPAFEALRRSYALRREFAAYSAPADHPERDWLVQAGFGPH
jgi:erythronate-4-phosphate dehydrogenase